MSDENKLELGFKTRRQVMSDEFVDRALNNASEFTMPVQEMVTEMCWGTTWQNDSLPLKTRSLITISMLVALRASNELKGHVRGALRNGCTLEEIQDTLLHATAYCGAPAGLEAFRAASDVIEEWQATP